MNKQTKRWTTILGATAIVACHLAQPAWAKPAKVEICHFSNGKPGRAQRHKLSSITVPARAVPSHLSHGDSPGACEKTVGALKIPSSMMDVRKPRIVVELVTTQDEVIDSSVVKRSGTFQLTGRVDGRIVAHLPDGTTLESAVSRDSAEFQWVNIPATLIGRYARKHHVSAAEADAVIRRHLRIPEGIALGWGLGETYRSFFSTDAFVKAAESEEVWLNDFIDQEVQRAEQGTPASYRVPRWPAVPGPEPEPDNNVQADTVPEVEKGSVKIADVPAVEPQPEKKQSEWWYSGNDRPAPTSYWGGMTQMWANVALWDVGAWGIGWAVHALGFGQDSGAKEDAIKTELINLYNDIEGLAGDFQTIAGITQAQNAATRIKEQYTEYNNYVNQGDFPDAVSLLTNYAGSSNELQDDLETLATSQLGSAGGSVPLVPLIAANMVKTFLGIGNQQSGANMFMDVRKNSVIQQVENFGDYYNTAMLAGLTMLSEYAHVDPNNTAGAVLTGGVNPALRISTYQTTFQQKSLELKQALQLYPNPTIASDDVLADLNNKNFVYLPIQGPLKQADAMSQAHRFNVFGTGWRYTDLQTTANIVSWAQQLGKCNGSTGSCINQGLYQLGIIADGSQTEDIIVFVYNDSVADNGAPGIPGSYNLTQNTSQNAAGTGAYNYILMRSYAGADVDPPTAAAVAYPESIAVNGWLSPDDSYAQLTGTGSFSQFSGSGAVDLTSAMNWDIAEGAEGFSVSNTGPTDIYPDVFWGTITYHANLANGTIAPSLVKGLDCSPGDQSCPLTYTDVAGSYGLVSLPTVAPSLVSISVSPYSVNYANTGGNGTLGVKCYASGFYSDNTVKDFTGAVSWSVTSTSGLAKLDSSQGCQLDLYQAQHDDTVTLTATYNGADAPGQVVGTGVVTTTFP